MYSSTNSQQQRGQVWLINPHLFQSLKTSSYIKALDPLQLLIICFKQKLNHIGNQGQGLSDPYLQEPNVPRSVLIPSHILKYANHTNPNTVPPLYHGILSKIINLNPNSKLKPSPEIND